MGGYCPDKLMSLKQQARLGSWRARAEHNLQEKWREEPWHVRLAGGTARTGYCSSDANRTAHVAPAHTTPTARTGAPEHGEQAAHRGSLWGLSRQAAPRVVRNAWLFRAAGAGIRRRKQLPSIFLRDGAVPGTRECLRGDRLSGDGTLISPDVQGSSNSGLRGGCCQLLPSRSS